MKRVLVANRGEIALRIIRGCREEGIESVAVYSDVDRLAPHVRAADVSAHIGPAPSSESYLNIERLLDAAKRTGADAVHPGYGFVAERADFAQAVARAGLTFIGPPPSAIAAMGDKTAARKRMREVGVPVVPGTVEPMRTVEQATRTAHTLGFPVLLKAAAGGGGRGMRVVRNAEEMEGAFALAQGEATKAFGDGRVYLERLLEWPRHVEIQVLADRHGRTIHLGERECSVQRRHQKLIEEAPSHAVTAVIRRQMGEAAVRAAQSVGYVSAGTCEFLLMPNGDFFFLEMNTRLQVEHPVTELVYGVDLVRMQLKIAMGHHLSLPERALVPRGWAMECRITCEDPFADFMPAGGTVGYMRLPAGPGVRWDGWVEPGTEVPLHYDSLLGKLIVWAESRERAIKRMRRVLDDLVIVGVPTSREFHQRVMAEPAFVAGEIDIGYWDRVGRGLMARPPDPEVVEAAAVATALLEEEKRAIGRTGPHAGGGPAQAPSGDAMTGWLDTARREGLR
ncbi:MAG: acetyl-CoA carboxylase biotin carboxylase subunit [Gemmatimonadetes bacterium]|nr:acetyl-CoA carboxylase biotin carboxylase subunit [Gemmatimonadota bacterium]